MKDYLLDQAKMLETKTGPALESFVEKQLFGGYPDSGELEQLRNSVDKLERAVCVLFRFAIEAGADPRTVSRALDRVMWGLKEGENL